MPDMNCSQNIGSALILCLSTISVILQPLLSKFSFLINLVSRNSSFSSPLLFDLRFLTDVLAFLLCSWSLPLLPLFFIYFYFFGIPMLAMSQSSSAFAQSVFSGDGMGFTKWSLVSTIMLSVTACLIFFLFFIFSLCHVNPTQVPYLCVNVICFVFLFVILGNSLSIINSLQFFIFGLMALHEVNV